MSVTNHIVLQCYGNKGVFYECALALLSLSRLYPHPPGDLEIWLYTDDSDWFESFKTCNLPLHYRAIDKATIQQWRGSIDFVHRIKIEVLRDFCKSHSGNVLYADTDVLFTAPLEYVWHRIEHGELYMHIMEGLVAAEANPILRKLNQFLAGYNASLQQLYMWNAGILGFHTDHAEMLEDVLRFTDKMHPAFPKHVVEQFAFSVRFQQHGQVLAASPYIQHYWNLKEARTVIASFLEHFKNAHWRDLVRYSAHIQPYELITEKYKFEHSRTAIEKLLNKKWTPAIPDWNELAKQV